MKKLIKERIDKFLNHGYPIYYQRFEGFSNGYEYRIGDIVITKEAPWLHPFPFLVYKYELSLKYISANISYLDGRGIFKHLERSYKKQLKKDYKKRYNNILEIIKNYDFNKNNKK